MTFIHPPLVLRFDTATIAKVRPDAEYVVEQYRTKHKSVYETSNVRILRGLLSEEVLARHRGVRRADVRHPWQHPYDVYPDIEVRTVQRPRRTEWWSDVALTLYGNDRGALARRWTLALLDYDRMDIRFLGWETGADRLAGAPVRVRSRAGREYSIIGMVHPDELRPMDELT